MKQSYQNVSDHSTLINPILFFLTTVLHVYVNNNNNNVPLARVYNYFSISIPLMLSTKEIRILCYYLLHMYALYLTVFDVITIILIININNRKCYQCVASLIIFYSVAFNKNYMFYTFMTIITLRMI